MHDTTFTCMYLPDKGIIKGQCKSRIYSDIIIPPKPTLTSSHPNQPHHMLPPSLSHIRSSHPPAASHASTKSPGTYQINPLVTPQPAASHASTKSPTYQINPLVTPQSAASHASTKSPLIYQITHSSHPNQPHHKELTGAQSVDWPNT